MATEPPEPVTHFPKLHPPYKRAGDYVVDMVRGDYEWVFDDAERVVAVEKLDGENVSVTFDDNMEPVAIHRRDGARGDPAENGYDMAEVPIWSEPESHYTEGLANAYGKGWIDYIDESGQHFGELVGPKVQGNRYDLDKHYWVPFAYARERLVMESYGEYETDFQSIRDWFDDGLIPLFYSKMHGGLPFDEASERCEVEGIVFTYPDPDAVDSHHMAKLRRDMFETIEGG